MSFIETKSLLAKLMATENLTVEHRNVQTASFDVRNRILTLPLFANLSPFLADLLVGHEVGHALETPEELLIKSRDLKIAKSVMNVIEDARIERKMKNRYPGLRTSFVKGYRELLDRDFFGVAGLDLNDLNFIDRVNMFYKAGAGACIDFVNETEKSLLKEINETETPDDVIVVSLKVMEYLKQEKEEKKKYLTEENNPEINYDDQKENDEDDDESGHEDDDGDESDDKNDDESGDGDEDGNSEKDDEFGEDSEKNDDSGGTFGDPTDEDIKSHTDEEFRKNENQLFEKSDQSYYYGNIPDVDIKELIIDHKIIWTRFKEWHGTELYSSVKYSSPKDISDLENYQKIKLDANKVVSYLAKEFELRKNADQMKRSSVAKTGMLNMTKVYSYKFSDDIFKRMTIIPDGKSHGLVMFLDWSGSMSMYLNDTIKQLINLSLFCKKVNIPFEVYAFTTEYDKEYRVPPVEGNVAIQYKFNLLNILSNRMSANDFTYACSKLLSFKDRFYSPKWFALGSTPLNECIIAAMKIIPEFQKRNKLQVVNTVFLTDGEGHDVDTIYKKELQYGKPKLVPGYGDGTRYNSKFILRDPVTKHQIQINGRGQHCTNAYLKLLKARTNCNIVGFYILSSRSFNTVVTGYFSSAANFDKLKASFRKDKNLVVTSSGYDEYYLIRAESMNTEEPEFTIKENATTRGLVSAFNKYATNRLTNRIILNRFIGMIA